MTNGEFVEILTKRAIEWAKTGVASMKRNGHMSEIGSVKTVDKRVAEAAVVDYINFVAGQQCCMDLAFYTSDLHAKKDNRE